MKFICYMVLIIILSMGVAGTFGYHLNKYISCEIDLAAFKKPIE